MGHGHSTTPSDVLFCQRNNRLWVTILIVSGLLVLALALILALQDGKLTVWKHGEPHPPATPTNQVAVGAVPPAAAGHQVAMMSPALSAPPMSGSGAFGAPRMPAADAPVDIQTRGGQGAVSHLQSAFNQVAKQTRPFVVNINAVRPTKLARLPVNPNKPQFVDPFDGIPDRVLAGVALESVGSGVIIDPSGYVITNDHLINGATSIMLTRFEDAEPLAATIVTSDPARDLALLKIQRPGPFPSAKLANSDAVQIGDWVIAVGNPFGLGHTVTAGIVSSRRSSVLIAGVEYKNLLQTDTPINQGSSGGPLLNLQGKVIGINTAIYAPTGVFNGTGFAIPSNQVGSFLSSAMVMPAASAAPLQEIPVAPTAIAPQPMQGSTLGIAATNVSPALAAKVGLSAPQGVFINSVDPGSPAEQAGLRRGDVIVELAGTAIVNAAALQAVLSTLPAGTTAPVVVQRDRQRVAQDVTLAFAAPAAVR